MTNNTVYHLTYPAANHYLAKKWDIAKHEKHLHKLKEMKPAIEMDAPIGFGGTEKDVIQRARKEVMRVAKDQEERNIILDGNKKILKKIAAIKVETHNEWIKRESMVKKSPFNPFLERRLKEQKRIELDNNKMNLKVETQKSGIDYQKSALLKYYERNKNVGRKYGDFETEELHQPDVCVRIREDIVVPRTKAAAVPKSIQTSVKVKSSKEIKPAKTLTKAVSKEAIKKAVSKEALAKVEVKEAVAEVKETPVVLEVKEKEIANAQSVEVIAVQEPIIKAAIPEPEPIQVIEKVAEPASERIAVIEEPIVEIAEPVVEVAQTPEPVVEVQIQAVKDVANDEPVQTEVPEPQQEQEEVGLNVEAERVEADHVSIHSLDAKEEAVESE